MEQQRNDVHQVVTIEEVNRLLDLGRILLSILTEEEIEQFNAILAEDRIPQKQLAEIGNTGVT